MALLTLENIVAEIALTLGTAIPTYTSADSLNTNVERFDWSEFSIARDTQGLSGNGTKPGEAKPLQSDTWTCTVLCRAKTFARAEHLRAALFTAARKVLGRNCALGTCQIDPPADDGAAWVARVELLINRPLLEAKLPISFADANTGKATINSVAHDATGATADGVLEVGES